MKNVDRKIIFECHVGSKLYGTNRPDSDDDFMGVFLPSTKESLGLNPFLKENGELNLGLKKSESKRNTRGDLDKKYYRVDKFLKLLAEGQSQVLEMLFCPESLWISSTPEWNYIHSNRDLFLSKNSIIPFCKFAKSQSLKAVIKGENLKTLRDIIELMKSKNKNKTMIEELNEDFIKLRDSNLIKLSNQEDNVLGVEIVGRVYLMTQKVKDVLRKLEDLEKTYGSRSENALVEGYDYKSLSHAYRLLFQSEFLLKNLTLEFPLPEEQVSFLKNVRSGNYQADFFSELDQMMVNVNKLKETSPLKEKVELDKVDEMCQILLYDHLTGIVHE